MRAFVSRPTWVPDHIGNHLKRLYDKLEELGIEPKTVGTNHTSFASPFDEVVDLMQRCDCAIILGFTHIWVRAGSSVKGADVTESIGLPSEWNHIEAAIALMLGKPTLMMRQSGLAPRGLFSPGSANLFVHEFRVLGPKWVEDTVPKLRDLVARVMERGSS
jgi:hypothetical protein